RTGSLYWRKSGWRARLTVDVDGVGVQKSFDLETTDKTAAKAKLRRLLKQGPTPTPVEAARPITVSEYAEVWVSRRKAVGVDSVEYEERYSRRMCVPAIGHKPLAHVTKSDVQAVLDDCATGSLLPWPRKEGQEVNPFSRQSIQHILATIV